MKYRIKNIFGKEHLYIRDIDIHGHFDYYSNKPIKKYTLNQCLNILKRWSSTSNISKYYKIEIVE